MSKLKRSGDGTYSGTYSGHAFTVRREQQERHAAWVARSGDYVGESISSAATRDNAVHSLMRAIDRAAVHVPEIEALLERWAETIKAMVPNLDPDDTYRLAHIRDQLGMFDTLMRSQAVAIERDIARLRARARPALEPAPPLSIS
jgi:hypothetical protein